MNIDRVLRTAPRGIPSLMANVARAMLDRDPTNRASCMELLEYPWFQHNGISSILDAQQTVAAWLEEVDGIQGQPVSGSKNM